MEAFATSDDLATLLNVEYTEPEAARVTALLESASDYLRGVIGQDVYPRRTATYTAYPSFGREDLPQWPVVSVDAIAVEGAPVPFKYRPGYVLVDADECDITFTFGYGEAPRELNRLACVLASQALQSLELTGALTSGGLSSVSIDDFRAAFADGGASTGIALPSLQQASIRRQFGQGGMTMVEAYT